MELLLAGVIGILFTAGIWLILRPRSFQVIMGLMLLSYAVNLLLFVSGQLWQDMPPIVNDDQAVDPSLYADPVPQALALTAIVIGFATTALYLVVLLASRGLTGTDHVDGNEQEEE
ncbi:Na+/H+ antiporter subunit C [Rheinheimera sp. MMS21-TC3]|uniref:Na+/H+ antiporter subunit C n=1 Tax=Rheinheimera sp. MMS21-TC3 TaxID=3072790 RepID=UPI0028C4376F|nr:Na+/H+ antiporter subunit C [Rheinheimera sp. MMS21-TC3]WNO59672.1 Na+/H+ antiporter subunit C [Rheinheimera sp. MMS21-TC3]